MGALRAIWAAPSAALLDGALTDLLRDGALAQLDHRRDTGYSRGGRLLAAPTVAAVARAALAT